MLTPLQSCVLILLGWTGLVEWAVRGGHRSVVLFLAQGFGLGRLRPAPGTWGTLPGFLLLWPVVACGGVLPAWFLTLGWIPSSIRLCGAAEKYLGRKDPGSVVMDEMVAVPLTFMPWLTWRTAYDTPWPTWGSLWTEHLMVLAAGFALFRLFDIWKPCPIGILQTIRGGWGVVVDDLLAALYASLVLLAIFCRG